MNQVIKKFIDQGVLLEDVDNTGNPVHRFPTPIKLNVAPKAGHDFRSVYVPEKEVGGYLIVRPYWDEEELILEIVQVKTVPNVSPTPDCSYLEEPKKAQDVREWAIQKEMLPIEFHTHPTPLSKYKGGLVDSNPHEFLRKLETSEQDRRVSDKPIKIGNYRLILPEALVVKKGDDPYPLFLGFYNGLIAPKSFEEEMDRRETEKVRELGKSIPRPKDQNEKRVFIGAGVILGLILLYFLIKNPKGTGQVLLGGILALIPIWKMQAIQEKDPAYFSFIEEEGGAIRIPST